MTIKMAVERLPFRMDMDLVVPGFLDELDHPWLQRLIERAVAADGMRSCDVEPHLLAPLPVPSPPHKHRLAAFMLERSMSLRVDSDVPPKEVRERVFLEAAKVPHAERAEALQRAAASLHMSAEQVMSALFADLPAERVVNGIDEPPSPGALAARANLWLAQSFVSRAARMTLDVKGASRQLLRGAKTKGLICTVQGSPDVSAAILDLSGPMSLFKRTRLYGRSLASLLPALAWCDRWILEAECVVNGRPAQFRLSTGAPILPSEPMPKRFDSKIEERFAKDFEKLIAASGKNGGLRLPWTLVREPRPIVVGDVLLFPDFALERPNQEPVFIELVGFWTPAYLEEKLARYRRARIANLVLCVDQDLSCMDGDLPDEARVVRFRRRVSMGAILSAIDAPVGAVTVGAA
jgi:predicted nuclease of restriction endonuclease-like RecB superfamily